MIVNSSQGGGSKDTWVLADELEEPAPGDHYDPPFDPPTMPGLRQAGWYQQERQQQQQGRQR